LRPVRGGGKKFGMMERERGMRDRAWVRASDFRYNMTFASLAVL
jgi:hypothetical protein